MSSFSLSLPLLILLIELFIYNFGKFSRFLEIAIHWNIFLIFELIIEFCFVVEHVGWPGDVVEEHIIFGLGITGWFINFHNDWMTHAFLFVLEILCFEEEMMRLSWFPIRNVRDLIDAFYWIFIAFSWFVRCFQWFIFLGKPFIFFLVFHSIF